jgi:hypothetical protein
MLVFGSVSFESHQDGSITVGVDNGKFPISEKDVRELISWFTWHQQNRKYALREDIRNDYQRQYDPGIALGAQLVPDNIHNNYPGALNRINR